MGMVSASPESPWSMARPGSLVPAPRESDWFLGPTKDGVAGTLFAVLDFIVLTDWFSPIVAATIGSFGVNFRLMSAPSTPPESTTA